MAALVLTDAQILLGAVDVSGFAGNFAPSPPTVATADVTPFGAGGYRRHVSALKDGSFSFDGFADFAATGITALFTPAALGTQYAASVSPSAAAAAVGDATMFTRGPLTQYTPWSGAVGEAAKFAMTLANDAPQIIGYILAPLASRGAVTMTAIAGVPAVTASQRVYGVLHVTGAVGTNLAWRIESAATGDSGFASPTTRLTFSTVSATGWQYISAAGPITDTRWRAVCTVGTSTFTSHVGFGIA